MTAAPSAVAAVQDILWCLGLGCLLGLGRDVLRLAFGQGSVREFLGDLLTFAAAAVLVAGFSAGVSAAGLARWYMSAAVFLGAVCWRTAAAPLVHGILGCLAGLLLLPLAPLHRRIFAPISAEMKMQQQKIFHFLSKKCRNPQKTAKKQLQNPTEILYN